MFGSPGPIELRPTLNARNVDVAKMRSSCLSLQKVERLQTYIFKND